MKQVSPTGLQCSAVFAWLVERLHQACYVCYYRVSAMALSRDLKGQSVVVVEPLTPMMVSVDF